MTDLLTELLDRGVEAGLQRAVTPPSSQIARLGTRRRRARMALQGVGGGLAVAALIAGVTMSLAPGGDRAMLAGPDESTQTVFITPHPTNLDDARDRCLLEAKAGEGRRQPDGITNYEVPGSRMAELNVCLSEAIGLSTFGVLDDSGGAVSYSTGSPERFTEANLRASGVVPGTLRDVGIGSAQAWLASVDDGYEMCFGTSPSAMTRCTPADVQYSSIAPLLPGTLIGGPVPTDVSAGSVKVQGRLLKAAIIRWERVPGTALVIADWPDSTTEQRMTAGMDFVPAS